MMLIAATFLVTNHLSVQFFLLPINYLFDTFPFISDNVSITNISLAWMENSTMRLVRSSPLMLNKLELPMRLPEIIKKITDDFCKIIEER